MDIQTNTTWKYDAVNAGWLTIEKDDVADQLVLNCEGNKVEEQQQATITITAGDKTATISATQNAYGTLEIAASKNNFQIPAVGELTAEFEVQSTDEDWIFETKDCPWLLLEQQGDKVTMTLDPNEEIEDRETTFVLIAGEGGGNPVSETIRVTQDRAVYVNVSLKTIPLSPTPTESDKKELGIRSQLRLGVHAFPKIPTGSPPRKPSRDLQSPPRPIRADRPAPQPSPYQPATANRTRPNGRHRLPDRPGPRRLHPRNEHHLVEPEDLSAVRQGHRRHHRLGRRQHRGERHLGLPLAHLRDPGYYIVSVKGSVTSLNSYDIPDYGLGNQFKEVYNWGRTGLTSMARAFQNCRELKRIPSDNTEAFAKVTTFHYAFTDCRVLEAVPDGLFDHATEAETFAYCFQNCNMVTEVSRRPALQLHEDHLGRFALLRHGDHPDRRGFLLSQHGADRLLRSSSRTAN